MTTSKATELARRRAPRAAAARESFGSSLALKIRQDLTFVSRVRFPNPAYQTRPVEFFREVLGLEPWSRQREILEAVRDHRRVAVRSGHKISKSCSAAGLALWFYCSFDDARVIMSSTTSRQVDQILWRELRIMRSRSGRCIACKAEDPEGLIIPKPCPHSTLIEGEQGDLARTGLKAPDFREVVGFTAREAEAVAGISGRNLLYILDEASGIPDEIYDAIEGNRAGGARIVLFGNPTRNTGEFYEAFHSKAHLYHGLTVSSEETPNAVSGEDLIPGLATREWIEEKREEWGEESALFRIRILGVHATHEEGRMFSVHTIEQAELRWHVTPDAGRLYIGVDPAGETEAGDESAFAIRRGLRAQPIITKRNLSAEEQCAMIVKLIIDHRLPREVPVVVVDAEGMIGMKLSRALAEHLEDYPNTFELVRVYASNRATRQPQIYERTRDELAVNLQSWFRDGGAIAEDVKLAAELHVLELVEQVNGRLKITPKETVRKLLGRSPDRLDALALSAWEPLSLRLIENDNAATAKPVPANDTIYTAGKRFDPYAAGNPNKWRGDR